jgi:5-methylcytosine-specific restriction endonuclease McrA
MNIKLPKKTKFRNSYAEIKNGILIIYNRKDYERVMHSITYATNPLVCAYCNEALTRKNGSCTIDHIIPRAVGGISIPDNLTIACRACNSEKSDMTKEEYLYYKKLNEKSKINYRKKLSDKHKKILKSGLNLPDSYGITTIDDVSKINFLDTEEKGKAYDHVLAFYEKYQRLPKPIILDRNWNLLDGLNSLRVAKEKKLKKVPVIILDNVECGKSAKK